MNYNPLDFVLRNSDMVLEEIKGELYTHIVEWVDVKTCPVCSDWPDEHAKHCTVCDGTRKIYIDYWHLYLPEK